MAGLPESAGVGPNPTFPPAETSLIPVVHIAPAIGWPSGTKPTPAAGTQVNAFASGLDHPRWLLVLPNGDVFVAESNAPAKSDTVKSTKTWISGLVMKRAAATTPSANRLTLLRNSSPKPLRPITPWGLTRLRSGWHGPAEQPYLPNLAAACLLASMVRGTAAHTAVTK